MIFRIRRALKVPQKGIKERGLGDMLAQARQDNPLLAPPANKS
jgi:hypothetical protein